jgi:hypothetical protein
MTAPSIGVGMRGSFRRVLATESDHSLMPAYELVYGALGGE